MLFLRNRLTIPVKGYNRSVIYDLNRKDYFFIPNELCEIINCDSAFEIKNQEYKKFLIENEIIFEVDECEIELFPPFDLTYETPYDFTSVIIDSDLDIALVEKFNQVLVFNVSILIKDSNSLIDNSYILDLIKKIEPECIDLHFINDGFDSIEANIEFLRKRNDIFRVYSYDSRKIPPKIQDLFQKRHIQLLEIPYTFKDYSKNVFPSKFSVNSEIFLESNHYNTFLYKKIYINSKGDISNGVNMKSIVNSIAINSFNDLLINPEFTENWQLLKDAIEVCKDCEFRHMCVSPLKILKKNHVYLSENECNYNPYISKWKFEKDYLDLTSIEVGLNSEKQFEINHDKIRAINKLLWNDK